MPDKDAQIFPDRRANTLQTVREKLPWPADCKFKILSLDGGGIRGLFGATLLAEIERLLPKGDQIGEYFDLVAGTSTGGIMALGIGLRVPATKIEDLYRVQGKEIFPPAKGLKKLIPPLRFLRRVRTFSYDADSLERALKFVFTDKKLGDSQNRLLIPAFKATRPEVTVLKTDHHKDYRNDWKLFSWQVARATSAAPTFLPGFASGENIYLDGGIWANNPVMLAVVEALSAFDIRPDQIRILSIGTGNVSPQISLLTAAGGGMFAWRDIINTAIYLTSDNADGQAGLLIGRPNILRLDPEEKSLGIELDDWKKVVTVMPGAAREVFAREKSPIDEFFITKVTPRHRFYST